MGEILLNFDKIFSIEGKKNFKFQIGFVDFLQKLINFLNDSYVQAKEDTIIYILNILE